MQGKYAGLSRAAIQHTSEHFGTEEFSSRATEQHETERLRLDKFS